MVAARRAGRADAAFAGLLLFVVLVYSNPGLLFFPEAGDVGIAKAAAGLGLGALGLSWLLGDRPLVLGGAVGVMLTLYFALVLASAGWSLWPAMTVTTFLDGTKYFAIFFLVANVVDTAGRARTLVHVIALASAIPAIGAISGWSRGLYLVEGDRAAWIGVFGNPNDLAYHCVVGCALTLGARELCGDRRALKLLHLASLGLIVTALLLTQSRGGLIAGGVVCALWLLRHLRRARVLAAGAAIVGVALWAGPAETWQRAGTTLHYDEDASAQGRIDAWRTGLNVMRGRPLTGVGAGAFPLAWAEYAPGDAGAARTAHNTFVQVGAETGLPSFVLFVGAALVAAFGLRAASRAADDRIAVCARAVQTALAGFVSCSLTGGLAWSWPLYLLLGFAAALARLERAGSPVLVPEAR